MRNISLGYCIIFHYYCTILLFLSEMICFDHTVEILTGGMYTGNNSWSKKRSEIDNCFKIYMLTDGELFLCDHVRKYPLQKKKLYFINGSKLVSQFCFDSFSAYWLHFAPKDLILHRILLSMPMIQEHEINSLNLVDSMEDIEMLFSVKRSSFADYYINLLRIQAFIQSLIVKLVEQHAGTITREILVIQAIEPAIQYIKTHFTEPVRLKQLAEKCYMSSNYFHKIFTQTLQVTPANFILMLRMNAALSLMLNEKCNIKEIAYQLGFCNDAYFSRVFKKYYGVTPGEYKQKRNKLLF